MRRAAFASATLHFGLIALLLYGLSEAGGAPSLGDGGSGSFEVVMIPAGGGAPADPGELDSEPTAAVEPPPAPPPAPPPGPEADDYLAALAAAEPPPAARQAPAKAVTPPAAAFAPPAPEPLPNAVEGPAVPLGEEAMVPPTAALVPPEPPPREPPVSRTEAADPTQEPPSDSETAEVPSETEERVDDPDPEELPHEEAVAPVEIPPEETVEEEIVQEEMIEEEVEEKETVEEQLAAAVPSPDARLDEASSADPDSEEEQEQAQVVVPPLKPTKEVILPEPEISAVPAETTEPARSTEQVATVESDSPGPDEGATSAEPQPGTAATESGGSDTPGTPGAAQVGLTPGELQDYAQLLLAWLERHKRYPDQARKRRQEGIVTVQFAIDGEGRVLSHSIVGASGVELLDQEVRALLARASPLPQPPDGGSHSFQLPIVFTLR